MKKVLLMGILLVSVWSNIAMAGGTPPPPPPTGGGGVSGGGVRLAHPAD